MQLLLKKTRLGLYVTGWEQACESGAGLYVLQAAAVQSGSTKP
jgi:hypothetical protein